MTTREQVDGRNGVDPLQTMDAMVWASEFMRLFEHRKDAIDQPLMLAWFANAIMRGFDEATRRNESALTNARRAALEEAAQIIGKRLTHYHTTKGVNVFTRAIQINEAEGCAQSIRAQAAQEEG